MVFASAACHMMTKLLFKTQEQTPTSVQSDFKAHLFLALWKRKCRILRKQALTSHEKKEIYQSFARDALMLSIYRHNEKEVHKFDRLSEEVEDALEEACERGKPVWFKAVETVKEFFT